MELEILTLQAPEQPWIPTWKVTAKPNPVSALPPMLCDWGRASASLGLCWLLTVIAAHGVTSHARGQGWVG